MNVLDMNNLVGTKITEVVLSADHITLKCGDGICVIKGQIVSPETLPVADQLSAGWVSEVEAQNKATADEQAKEAALAANRRATYEQLKTEFDAT